MCIRRILRRAADGRIPTRSVSEGSVAGPSLSKRGGCCQHPIRRWQHRPRQHPIPHLRIGLGLSICYHNDYDESKSIPDPDHAELADRLLADRLFLCGHAGDIIGNPVVAPGNAFCSLCSPWEFNLFDHS